jgi:uncharacterized NAD(P)/FAD-binding protein YdhS
MESSIHRIAVVGNGPTGVGVFYELVHFLKIKNQSYGVSITLIEKSQDFGSGMPYGTKLDAHVINMTVSTMSLKSDQVDHFYNWLLENPEKWRREYNISSLTPYDVVPRRLFGIYVNQMYKEAREMAEKLGIHVETVKGEATELSETRDGVRLRVEHREKLYNQVFVCVGNTSPAFGQELKDTPGYFHDVWPEEVITRGIPNHEPVAILGSGLTAIDVMITLQEKGHHAPITMVSRQGLLPKVRNRARPYELTYLSPRNIQKETRNGRVPLSLCDCVMLLRKEFENANLLFGSDDGYYRASNSEHIEILKQDIARVKNGHANYFSVLKAIDKDAGLIWNAMSLEARTEFDHFYSTLWNIHCYPMPLINGERTLGSLESGQLTVRGGFQELSYDRTRETFQLRTKLGSAEDTLETRFVINATGQGMDLVSSRCRLLRNGVESGALVSHPLGGIDVDFRTGRARAKLGGYSQRIYAVGLLTRGVHFYTNSIVENVRCAKRAAADAVEHIEEGRALTVPISLTLSELGRAVATHQADR